MKEIGGYFGLEKFSGREYHTDLIGVNSGRNALLYILKARSVQKLYIPCFLCDTVARLCEREGYAYESYSITKDFLPDFSKKLLPGEWLYIVNFYGRISNKQLLELKLRWENIIFDNVHAFFQKPLPDVDTVYSCRKFFGVPDGGYVACKTEQPLPLERDISKDRMKHILGRFEESGSAFYREFQANDESFYEMPLRKMSALTQNILCGIDYEAARRRRNENYAFLQECLGKHNSLPMVMPDGPYAYPFYCENGMQIKKRLAAEKIYVATLWPNVLEDGAATVQERSYAENILPLPCDQRYLPEDMRKICSVLLACMGKGKGTC